MLVQMDVGDLPGVESVSSDHRTGVTEVTFEDTVVSPDDIIAAVVKAGYGAEQIGE
jgi:copper chaperone CopZ